MKKFCHLQFNCDSEAMEILIAELADIGFDSFEEQDHGFNASVDTVHFSQEEFDRINDLYSGRLSFTYRISFIDDKNWNEEWEKNFQPIIIDDRCQVRASFHPPKPSLEFDLVIDPKMSFGTGHHDTTSLMISNILQLDIENKTVLDAGCGTGVLSILSEKKLAHSVIAYDIDHWAFENTVENIACNGCKNIEVHQGDSSVIPESLTFDIILANINRNIILEDMKNYVQHLNLGGILVLSGFYETDREVILNEADNYSLRLTDSKSRNHWLSLVFNRISL